MPPVIQRATLRHVAAIGGAKNTVDQLTSQQSGGISGTLPAGDSGVWNGMSIRTGVLPPYPCGDQDGVNTAGVGIDVLVAAEQPIWRIGNLVWYPVDEAFFYITGAIQLDLVGNPRLVYDGLGIRKFNADGTFDSWLVEF